MWIIWLLAMLPDVVWSDGEVESGSFETSSADIAVEDSLGLVGNTGCAARHPRRLAVPRKAAPREGSLLAAEPALRMGASRRQPRAQ